MTSLVPTPSVDEASSGLVYFSTSSANSPAKPPMPPTTSGLAVLRIEGLRASTARSPASMSTPEEA